MRLSRRNQSRRYAKLHQHGTTGSLLREQPIHISQTACACVGPKLAKRRSEYMAHIRNKRGRRHVQRWRASMQSHMTQQQTERAQAALRHHWAGGNCQKLNLWASTVNSTAHSPKQDVEIPRHPPRYTWSLGCIMNTNHKLGGVSQALTFR